MLVRQTFLDRLQTRDQSGVCASQRGDLFLLILHGFTLRLDLRLLLFDGID